MSEYVTPTPFLARFYVLKYTMRIVTIIGSAETGGAEALIQNWSDWRLSKANHLLIIIKGKGFFSQKYEDIFLKVVYLNASYNPVKLLLGFFKAILSIIKFRPNIIHTHLAHADILGLLFTFLKFSVVTTIHSSSITTETKSVSRFLVKTIAKFSRCFAGIICVSNSGLKYAIELGYDSRNMRVIPNGVPSNSPINPLTNFNFGFLNLARWHPVKDHATLIEGFFLHQKEHSGCYLLLAGNQIDSSNKDLKSLIEETGSKTILLNEGPGDSDLLLQSAKALVISSTTESLPMAGLEALSVGVPVITSKVGDFKSLIISERQSFDIQDPIDLARALAYICSLSQADYSKLSSASLNLFNSNYSSDKWIQAHIEFFEDMLELK